MLLLLNSTKTMNLKNPVPILPEKTEPALLEPARLLAGRISRMSRSQLAEQMSLSDKLACETLANAKRWGQDGRPNVPALFGFTGLVYKSLDAASLDPDHLKYAAKRVRILSGLYGILRPFDRIEAYRLEMGHKLAIGRTKTLAAFWQETLTDHLNVALKAGEPVVNLAAQEYIRALDLKKLNGPVISPVFKEKKPDGTLRTVVVHAKKARGKLLRYALITRAENPMDLTGFTWEGWKAAENPPASGTWLFTRPTPP